MKEITKERIVKDVVGYKAFDGRMFDNKRDCEKYERKTANEMLKNLIVGETTQDELYNGGYDDCLIYIISIKNSMAMNDAKIINQVFGDLFKDEDYGKEVIICTYDIGYSNEYSDYYREGTIDEIICNIKNNYEGAKKYYAEEKRK